MNNIWKLFKLDNNIAVVTGGARNLGFDMALALAEAGADVVITSRNLSDAEVAVGKIAEATGRTAFAIELDVKHEIQVEAMIDTVIEKFGRIDILVNNAGNVSSTPKTAPLDKRPLELWQEVIDTNLTGTFLCSKHAVAKL